MVVNANKQTNDTIEAIEWNEVASKANAVTEAELGYVAGVTSDIQTQIDSKGDLSNIVEDTTPELGGDLDVNGNHIVSSSNNDINLLPNGTGKVKVGDHTKDELFEIAGQNSSLTGVTFRLSESSGSDPNGVSLVLDTTNNRLKFVGDNQDNTIMYLNRDGNVHFNDDITTDGDITIDSNQNNGFILNDSSGNQRGRLAQNTNGGYFLLKNTSQSDTVLLASNGVSYFNGGSLGIGQTTASARLHVNSGGTNISAIFESTDAGAGIQLQDNSTTTGAIVQAIGDDLMLRVGNSNVLYLESGASSDSLRINSDSSVDVGQLNYTQADANVVSLGNLGSTETIDWSSGAYQEGTLDSNVTITHSNEVTGRKVTIALAYDGSAQRTITWSDVDKWSGGSAPDAPSASGEVLVVTLMYIGTTCYASAEVFS